MESWVRTRAGARETGKKRDEQACHTLAQPGGRLPCHGITHADADKLSMTDHRSEDGAIDNKLWSTLQKAMERRISAQSNERLHS